MAMAVSRCAGGVLSPVSPRVSCRLKKCVAGRVASFVSLSNSSARRPSFGILLGASGGECGFSLRAVGRLYVPNEGAVLRKRAERWKPRHTKGENRQIGLPASSSSSPSPLSYTEETSFEHGDGGNGFSGRGGGGGGGGGGGDHGFGGSESGGAVPGGGGGILGSFIRGWDARVEADPQFVFKVLMEQIVGVGACLIGDLASRPNFGLNELDLVFSTLVVGSIVNFALMYMLAPSAAAGAVASKLPGMFAKCPSGHMFEIGSYSVLERAGTFVYKGSQFAVVGFVAGLVGTGISSSLINARKKVDPSYVPQNASPPVLLNAATWALHMGISSNARYQSLNGLEFALAKALSPGTFQFAVPLLRALNNAVGGTSFVALARLTGSQPRQPLVPPQGQRVKKAVP